MNILSDEVVLVLDLDDTLYKELDYARSGLSFVVETLHRLYPGRSTRSVESISLTNARFSIEDVMDAFDLPRSAGEQILWMYRSHTPRIVLSTAVREWLGRCERHCHAVVILTDGRSITQRLKLEALGLLHLPSLISEEQGGNKPDPSRFVSIENRWRGKRYVYVGDNPRKDFFAPNRRGWMTVGLRGDEDNVHRHQAGADSSGPWMPAVWIDRLEELVDVPTAPRSA